MASIFVRFDNVVLVLILLAWLVWKQRVRSPLGTMLGVIAMISTVLINRLTGYYGWHVLMQHSFIKPEIEPVNHPVLINFAGYLHALSALRVIPYTFMTIWLLVAVAVWKRLPSESVFRDLLPLAGIAILVRLAIFPDLKDRYYVWAYLFAGVALIRTSQTGAWLDD